MNDNEFGVRLRHFLRQRNPQALIPQDFIAPNALASAPPGSRSGSNGWPRSAGSIVRPSWKLEPNHEGQVRHASVTLEELHASLSLESPSQQPGAVLKKCLESTLNAAIPNASSFLQRNQVALQRHPACPPTTRNIVEIVPRCSLSNALVLARHKVADIKYAVEPIGAYPVATQNGARKDVVLVAAVPPARNLPEWNFGAVLQVTWSIQS